MRRSLPFHLLDIVFVMTRTVLINSEMLKIHFIIKLSDRKIWLILPRKVSVLFFIRIGYLVYIQPVSNDLFFFRLDVLTAQRGSRDVVVRFVHRYRLQRSLKERLVKRDPLFSGRQFGRILRRGVVKQQVVVILLGVSFILAT